MINWRIRAICRMGMGWVEGMKYQFIKCLSGRKLMYIPSCHALRAAIHPFRRLHPNVSCVAFLID
jgi:hypothetical protein